jgi:hypothetical protein
MRRFLSLISQRQLNKVLVIIFLSLPGFAQDVEKTIADLRQVKKREVLTVTGSVPENNVFYHSKGITQRRDPFYWILNANLTFLLFEKISVPFTAVFTQQDKNYSHGLGNFSQAFNQFGISPKYKWLTLHLGYRTMEFSEYSLAGVVFLGGGIEIKPPKALISGAACYGRFIKAVPHGGVDGIVVSLPAFERWGGAGKVRVGKDDNYAEIIFMKLKDDVLSIPFDTVLTVLPQENQVTAIKFSQKLPRKITISGEVAYSMFTRNLYERVQKIESFTYINQVYDPRPSSQYNKALNFSADYTPGKFKIGLKYKRIDPDYRTLGSVFLTNDVEEISANYGMPLFKNKVTVQTSLGLQSNNLDRIQAATSKRIIGAINTNVTLNDHVNFSADYSSFSSNTIPVRDVLSDSIRLVQLTQSGSLNSSIAFGNERLKHNVCSSIMYQQSGGNKQPTGDFLNVTLSHQLLFPGSLRTGVSILYNRTSQAALVTSGFGPSVNLQKQFFKNQLRVQGSVSHQLLYSENKKLSDNLTVSAGAHLQVTKQQTARLETSWVTRAAAEAASQSFTETRISLGYTYNFGMRSSSSKKI